MSITYEAHRFDEIPPLAWLLDFPLGPGRPTLYHGRHVELFDSGFFEGAWDGDFLQAGFDQSANVFGSGAKLDGSSVILVPPSHTLESLVFFTGSGRSAASNSLPFLCAFCDFDIEPIDWRSGKRFASITQGLDHAMQALSLRDGLLTIIYHHNVLIAGGAVQRVMAKLLPPHFEDFSAYYRYLLNTARDVCANAGHSGRMQQYELLATLSAGYDSSAAAAIATALGCREAVSLKRTDGGRPDSGAELAKAFGLSLREFERERRASGTAVSVAEFLCAGMSPEDYILYRSFQDVLSGKILFTGTLGDVVWEKGRVPSHNLRRPDLTASGIGEFRLSRDFVLLPVPYIGCLRHPDLHLISNSDEMAPYSVRGKYDRPIPRRIAESAGAPRAAFGQSKRAQSVAFRLRPALLPENVRADIAAFERELRLPLRERLRATILAAGWRIGLAMFHRFRGERLRGYRLPTVRMLWPVGRLGVAILPRLLGPYEVFEHGHPRNAIWQRWAIARVKPRYASVARRGTSTDPHSRAGAASWQV